MKRLLKGRSLLLAIGVLVASVALSACSDADSPSGGEVGQKDASELNIFYSVYERDAAFFRGCIAGAQAAAEKHGANLEVTISGPDATKQIQQLENSILRQPDAIILTSIDANAVQPVLDKITDAGIPVIAICDEAGSIKREPGPGRLSYIGPDYNQMAEKKMEYIVERLRQEDRADGAKIASFFGVRGVPFDVAQRAGYDKVISDAPEITYIKGPYTGEYTATAGLEATQNVLAADPDIVGLTCDNSDTCLGAVKAIEEAGIKQDDILVTSNDAIPPELDEVRSGRIDFTVALCSYNHGEMAVEQIVDLLVNGKLPPAYTLDAGRDIAAKGQELKSQHINTAPVGPDTEPTTERCSDPAFEVIESEPNMEQAQALGIDSAAESEG